MKGFKEFLTEKKNDPSIPGGADYEAAIVVGYYNIQKLPLPPLSEIQVSEKDYSKIIKSQELKKGGERIAESILKKVGKNKKATQLGRASFPITEEWKEGGGRDNTPKTDLLIGKSKISLKIGPSQLMSGAKGESTSTFLAALKDNPDIRNSKEIKEILKGFENFVVSGFTKQGNVEDYTKKTGKFYNQDAIIAEGDRNHKIIVEKLRTLFEKHRGIKIAFAREAMSGIHKFGEKSNGSANYFLVGDSTGQSISYHDIKDENYIERVADSMNVSLRFKSNSVKRSGVKTGAYRYYSVITLALRKLNESMENFEKDYSRMLNETKMHPVLLRENLFAKAWDDFKKFLTNLLEDVMAWIVEKTNNILDFFEIEPEIEGAGIGNPIQLPL